MLFDSHHPLKHKLGVIRTLNHGAETVPTKKHIRGALKNCGYQNWTFVKTSKEPKQTKRRRQENIVIPYVAGTSEKLRKICQGCTDLYIGETKQPLHKPMAQHWRANFSGQDSEGDLEEKNLAFENNVNILAREDRWFERGVKESIYVKLE